MKKTFVIDSSVLLHDPGALFKFDDNNLVLAVDSVGVLEATTGVEGDIGSCARKAVRALEGLRERGSLADGVLLRTGGSSTLRVAGSPAESDILPKDPVLRLVHALQKKDEGKVILVTKNVAQRVRCVSYGLESQDYLAQKATKSSPAGHRTISVSADVMSDLQHDESALRIDDELYETVFKDGGDMYPNEFVVIANEEDNTQQMLTRVDPRQPDKLCHVGVHAYAAHIVARTEEQMMSLELLFDPDVHLVTLVGPSGTGKSLISIAAGIEQVTERKLYETLHILRPIAPFDPHIGDDEEAGLLPLLENLSLVEAAQDDENENFDSVEEEHWSLHDLRESRVIQVAAIRTTRGPTLHRSFVVIDQCQNLTPYQLKALVSRAGQGTKLVLLGDINQIDNPALDSESNGLTYTVERLQGSSINGHVTFKSLRPSLLAGVALELL